ncbi:PIN domain-containing protein [bacterium]|nr:PIN domain-containing protein [bacterium]
MAKKISVYVDTGAFIAFLDQADTFHPLFLRLFSDPPKLLTSSLVIAEAQAWFLKRYDSYKALQFMSFIEDLKNLEIQGMEKTDIAGATRVLRDYSDQKLTLADASGLWLMKKFKIKSCWSTDRHLNLTGVPLVIYQ